MINSGKNSSRLHTSPQQHLMPEDIWTPVGKKEPRILLPAKLSFKCKAMKRSSENAVRIIFSCWSHDSLLRNYQRMNFSQPKDDWEKLQQKCLGQHY